MNKKTQPTFADQIDELEALVEAMESGDMSLDESLKAFEKGVKMVQTCRKTLTKAQQKVSTIKEQAELDDD